MSAEAGRTPSPACTCSASAFTGRFHIATCPCPPHYRAPDEGRSTTPCNCPHPRPSASIPAGVRCCELARCCCDDGRTTTVTTLPGETDADACRRLGWGPGTVLIGDEGYGPSIIRITAVGERYILALSKGWESMWTLACRDWQPFFEEASR